MFVPRIIQFKIHCFCILRFNGIGIAIANWVQIRNAHHFPSETHCSSIISCLHREITHNPSFCRITLARWWFWRSAAQTYLSFLTNYACVQLNVINFIDLSGLRLNITSPKCMKSLISPHTQRRIWQHHFNSKRSKNSSTIVDWFKTVSCAFGSLTHVGKPQIQIRQVCWLLRVWNCDITASH